MNLVEINEMLITKLHINFTKYGNKLTKKFSFIAVSTREYQKYLFGYGNMPDALTGSVAY